MKILQLLLLIMIPCNIHAIFSFFSSGNKQKKVDTSSQPTVQLNNPQSSQQSTSSFIVPPTQGSTFNFNISLNSESINTSNLKSNPHQSIDNNLSNTLSSFSFKQLPLEDWQKNTTSFFKTYKYWIGGSIILGIYLILCYEVIKGNKYLNRTDTWVSWKKEHSLEQLFEIPQSALAKELLREIQMRYTTFQNPTDFIKPLVTFIQDADREMRYLKYYLNLSRWIDQLYLSRIFPINKRNFKHITEKIQRLAYLKNLFLSWTAEYKIDQNIQTRSIQKEKRSIIQELFLKLRTFLIYLKFLAPPKLEKRYLISSSPNLRPIPKNPLAFRLLIKSSAPKVA